MTHGLVAIASAAVTTYALIPATDKGGFHLGLAIIVIACAVVGAFSEGTK